MRERIRQLASEDLANVRALRREMHRHPELAHEEFETQRLIERELDRLGISHHRVAETGVLGIIEGRNPGRVVLLRADMDALPIQEETGLDYSSEFSGKMHACGHDGHTAGLLGAAYILKNLSDDFDGTVKLMFQPAEETDGGAQPMIEEGILENPRVEAAFGLHLAGHLPEGQIDVRYGAMYGAPDEFRLLIKGRGGHAASPEQTIDPISIGVQIIQSAQFLLTRRLDPVRPAVISFTSFHAGEGLNVIPETAEIGGTIRTLYPDTREAAARYLQETIASICTVNGASFDFEFMPSYPPLINDPAMTDLLKAALISQFGSKSIGEQPFPSLGAEDFAFLAVNVPSSYFLLGIHEEGKPEPVHHHPAFAWNDEVLELGSQALARVALDFLASEESE